MFELNEFRLKIIDREGAYVAAWITDVEGESFRLELPLSARDAKELQRYLATDRKLIQGIDAKLKQWGEQLFEALFVGRSGEFVAERIQQLIREKKRVTITIASNDARIHMQPWEMLRDARGPMLLHGVTIRRQLVGRSTAIMRKVEPLPLRVLLVVARPNDASFLDPRSSLRPMFETFEVWPEGLITVDFCEPPTFSCLEETISEARKRGRPYDVLHFDGHGRYLAKTGVGVLAFEQDDAKTDLIRGVVLGDLLSSVGLPLVVLEACRSSALSDRSIFGSVAPALLKAGVGSAAAFSHSVHTEASRIFVESFYRNLAAGLSVGRSIEEARSALYVDRGRGRTPGPRGEIVELQDWFVPQLYQVGRDPVLASSSQTSEKGRRSIIRLKAWKNRLHDFPPGPLYGFHGRAFELLDLERALRLNPGVLLAAMEGMGKTALAVESANWWLRTGRFERAVFHDFGTRASVAEIVHGIGSAYGDPDFFRLSVDRQRRRAAEWFRERKVLLVWDGVESTTSASQRNHRERFSEREHHELRRFYSELIEGGAQRVKGRILATGRSDQVGLSGMHKVSLRGLPRRDGLQLLTTVVESREIPVDGADWELEQIDELLQAIGGNPLMITLIASRLHEQTPKQVREKLQISLPKRSGGDESTESDWGRGLRSILEGLPESSEV